MPTYQKWRLYVDQKNGGSYCAITELEFRTSAGVSRSFSGGTLSWNNSAFGSSYDGNKAADGNTGTHWISDVAHPWFQYDYGSGNECDIVEVYIRCLYNSSWSPQSFSIQYWDGAAWVTKFKWLDVTISVWGARPSHAFAQQDEYQLWRLRITAGVDSTYLNIAEAQFRESVGVSKTFSGGYQFWSQQTGSAEASKVIDNDTGTYWYAGSLPTPQFFYYDYGSGNGFPVVQFTVTAAAGYAPKDFSLDYYDPGTTDWVTAASYTGETGWSAGETRTYDGLAAPPAATRRPLVFLFGAL